MRRAFRPHLRLLGSEWPSLTEFPPRVQSRLLSHQRRNRFQAIRHFSTPSNLQAIPNSRPRYAETPETASEQARLRAVRELVGQGKLFDPVSHEPLVQVTQMRNACKCELCVNPSDRQRNYHWADIPDNIEVAGYDVDSEGTYSVRWKNDIPEISNHVSRYTRREIMEAAYFLRKYGQTVHQRDTRLWDNSTYNINANTTTHPDFMGKPESLALVLHHLHDSGLVFITEVPKDEMSVGKIAERIGTLRNTFYGLMWDVRSVPNAKNVAYTSRNLGFHMDLLYMQEPPGLQLLHCMENTCQGGLSRFVDTFKALDEFISQHGNKLLRALTNAKIPYEYHNDGEYYYDRKPVVSFDAYPKLPRILRNARHAELLFRVQRVYWSPPFTAPQMSNFNHEHRELIRAAKAFADILEAPGMAVTTKLPPGTCVIFDNLRVVHARTAFDTSAGHRWLRGAYIDHQDFYSKVAALEGYMPSISKVDM